MIVVQKIGSMGFSGQLASILNRLGRAWWVEVTTQSPTCVYYFGPFASPKEAEAELPGYLEDLAREGAQGVKVTVKRCQPKELTVCEEGDGPTTQIPNFSQQVP